MSGTYLAQLHAAAFIDDDGTIFFEKNVAAFKTGTGVYSFNLGEGLDSNGHLPTIVLNNGNRTSSYANISDTLKRVSVFNGATAALTDCPVYIAFWRLS